MVIKIKRYRRCILVAHCILNPEARAKKASRLRTIDWELISLLQSFRVSFIQMPCPGLLFYGYDREGEDRTPRYRNFCNELAKQVCNLILALKVKASKLRILGIIGIDNSPTCAVSGSKGIFIQELEKEMKKRNISIPLLSWTFHEKQKDERCEEIRNFLMKEIESEK